MKIGMLTGGGDCPGLNPALRGAVLRLLDYGDEVIGFQQGWKGLVEGNTEPLTLERVEGIIDQGGTILRSSRTNPFAKGKEAQLEAVLANIKKFELDALIALGGEDTLGVASKLFVNHGVPTVGVPKTMDNDLDKTDYTFGFDSAASVALDSIDRLRDTAKSHDRVIVVEIMGRHAGWMALWSGVAGGADWILIPEVEFDVDAMCKHLQALYARGKTYGIVAVSEGVEIPGAQKSDDAALDAFGHHQLGDVGIGPAIAKEIGPAPASRPAMPFSAMSCAAVPRPCSTASSVLASASKPPSLSTKVTSARWLLCKARRSSQSPFRKPSSSGSSSHRRSTMSS